MDGPGLNCAPSALTTNGGAMEGRIQLSVIICQQLIVVIEAIGNKKPAEAGFEATGEI
jgi:hypothetical protein